MAIRGNITAVNGAGKSGVIESDLGKFYTFDFSAYEGSGLPEVGKAVVFDEFGSTAVDIHPLEEKRLAVILTKSGPNKIGLIKALREIGRYELSVAKRMVENTPQLVWVGTSRQQADELKASLITIGAGAEVRNAGPDDVLPEPAPAGAPGAQTAAAKPVDELKKKDDQLNWAIFGIVYLLIAGGTYLEIEGQCDKAMNSFAVISADVRQTCGSDNSMRLGAAAFWPYYWWKRIID